MCQPHDAFEKHGKTKSDPAAHCPEEALEGRRRKVSGGQRLKMERYTSLTVCHIKTSELCDGSMCGRDVYNFDTPA